MELLIAGLALAIVAALVAAISRSPDHPPLTRRAALRLVILGASGLSLLPGCILGGRRTHADEEAEPEADTALEKWSRLGRIWREMSTHLKGRHSTERKAEFESLKDEMEAALNALPAWPALRAVCEERWAHIHRIRYFVATCYVPVRMGTMGSRGKVEQQVKALEELVAEGKLTTDAARKAASALAIEAEFMARWRALGTGDGVPPDREVAKALWDEYEGGTLQLTAGATAAGQRLTELTVDRLGLLAGPCQESEGPYPTCYVW